MSRLAPRAVGVRMAYASVPAAVRRWVDDCLGSRVVQARTQRGGMSPGCAARLVAADGRRAFVKAVGPELNPQTPDLFRHEARVLSVLAAVPYRPGLLGTHDDGDWVGLLLEDVDGQHPDLSDAAQARVVWDIVATQCDELTPAPSELAELCSTEPAAPVSVDTRTVSASTCRWSAAWQDMLVDPGLHLPAWAVPVVDELADRVAALPGRLSLETFCHWDLRNDNLLVRADGSAVVVDWGMSRLGPRWGDLFVLALERAETPAFDRWIDQAERTHGADQAQVTSLLLALGGYLAVRSADPPAPGLPSLPAFRRREADRFLAAARRRLQGGGNLGASPTR